MLIAFPRQQWLRERASVLRHTYIICLNTVAVKLVSSGMPFQYCCYLRTVTVDVRAFAD